MSFKIRHVNHKLCLENDLGTIDFELVIENWIESDFLLDLNWSNDQHLHSNEVGTDSVWDWFSLSFLWIPVNSELEYSEHLPFSHRHQHLEVLDKWVFVLAEALLNY
jgi:hypothetical protein